MKTKGAVRQQGKTEKQKKLNRKTEESKGITPLYLPDI